MAHTTQCTQCGIVLNVPDHAIGKRLKCPRCGTKFALGPGAEGSPSSTFLLQSPKPPSSQEEIARRPGSSAEALPTSAGGVRETFDLPLLNEVAAGAKANAGAAVGSRPTASANANAKPVGDATALFQDNPKSSRRPSAAEARSQARRCPTCGGVVPVGMSICSRCGLDLESGARVALDDVLAPPPPPPPSLPLPIGIIGGICLLGSAIFTVAALALWIQGYDGYQYFIPLCLFGIYAAVQFLRLKSARLLLMALTFGLAIDIIALIAMPVYHANIETGPVERTTPVDDPDRADVIIPSVVERLDTQKISLGIGLIGVYAAVSVYLLSPQVRRHFH